MTDSIIQEVVPTAAEAAATLAGRMADKPWVEGFLQGGPQLAEYRKLSEIAVAKSADEKVDLAMAGKYLPINDSEHLTRMGTASMLRDAGISNDVIKQALSGQPVSQAEHDAATTRKAALMRDHEWSKQYLAGNGPQREEMTLLNVILSSDVKREKSA